MNSKGRVAVGGGSQTVKHLLLHFCGEVDLKVKNMAVAVPRSEKDGILVGP